MSLSGHPNICYVDGQFLPSDAALIPANDLAILRGYAVFDVLRAYDGLLFRLKEHCQRLLNSAAQIELAHPYTLETLMGLVRETFARNQHPNALVRIVLTGGDGLDSITPLGNPRLIIWVMPFVAPREEEYQHGVKVITTTYARFMPTAKTIHYIPAIMAMNLARQHHAAEAIYLGENGRVMEGTRSSLFARLNGEWVTGAQDILAGITRQVLLEIHPAQVHDFSLAELYSAEEVCLVSTTKEVMPVVQVDDTLIGNGLPGTHTLALLALFRETVQAEIEAQFRV